MRISDWSSDVCSSDLLAIDDPPAQPDASRADRRHPRREAHGADIDFYPICAQIGLLRIPQRQIFQSLGSQTDLRSEERRVGNECVRTRTSRWTPDHYTKHTTKPLTTSLRHHKK